MACSVNRNQTSRGMPVAYKNFKSGARFGGASSRARNFGTASAPKPSEDNIDLEYEACEGVSEVLDAVRSKAPVILVSGRAGTGKSRLINYLASIPDGRRQMVVAPTGIAALNVGAATIHSTFALPFGPIDAQRMESRKLPAVLKKVRRLIIDEISMVRADMLDAIDQRLRTLMDSDRPFGGIQIILVGDFLQLPPVVKREDEEVLDELGYETPFAFSAKVLDGMPLKVVTLQKVWRQADEEFISMLGKIRDGRSPEVAVEWLNERCFRPARDGSKPMMLTPTRSAADAYNTEGINKQRRARRAKAGLDQTAKPEEIGEFIFRAQKKGSFENAKQLPVPEVQPLIPGARVMAIRNDPEGNFVNGSLGTVLAIDDDKEEGGKVVKVKFDGSKRVARVAIMEWEDVKYSWGGEGIEKKIVGTYTQIPLVLGYATTIHKCQGLTLEDVRIDLGRGAFAAGQLYVALSRAKSVEGLSLERAITPRDVQVDAMLTEFLAWAGRNENLDITVAK
jgi:ATP-dependent DNA helicase PIF1